MSLAYSRFRALSSQTCDAEVDSECTSRAATVDVDRTAEPLVEATKLIHMSMYTISAQMKRVRARRCRVKPFRRVCDMIIRTCEQGAQCHVQRIPGRLRGGGP